MPHNINFREKKAKLSKKDKKAEGGSGEDGTVAKGRVARFRYFEDISGYSGVRDCSHKNVHDRPLGTLEHAALEHAVILCPPNVDVVVFISGVYLRTLPSLDAGDLPRCHETPPHDHRRFHRVLLALPQHQLPQRLPLLQQAGTVTTPLRQVCDTTVH